MSDESVLQSKRLRFSILTLMLITAIVALTIAVGTLYREVGPLREEVTRLRREVGVLDVQDPTKLHAIRVETSELEWKWRIWVPEKAQYRLRSVDGKVPEEGFPQQTGGTITLRDPGEHVVRYVIRRDPRDGRWYGSLRAPGAAVGKDLHRWVEWGSTSSRTTGVGSTTESFETDRKQVELIRHRVSNTSENAGDGKDTSSGFLVWLEPL